MESTKKRVLAYTLAKEITRDELTNISGGSWFGSTCRRPSGNGGASNNGWEVSVDITLDW